MSTRATIKITQEGRQQWMYHHHDGYPDGVGKDLADYFEKHRGVWDMDNIITDICDNYAIDYGYERTHGEHGDEEYAYVIDCDAKNLSCYRIGANKWDELVFCKQYHDDVPEQLSDLMNNPVFKNIRSAAQKAHESVNQKYDGKPYIYHLDDVMCCLMESVKALNEIIPDRDQWALIFAAYFHDAMEDARMNYSDILEKARDLLLDSVTDIDCINYCADLVYTLTAEKGKNRAQRECDRYWANIRSIQWASLLKVCDRLANMRYSAAHNSSILKAYRMELDNMLNNINLNEIPESILNELKNL